MDLRGLSFEDVLGRTLQAGTSRYGSVPQFRTQPSGSLLLRGWGGVLPDSIVQSKRFFPSTFVLLWSSKCGPPEYNGRGCEPGPGPAAPWDRLLSCSQLQFALLLDGVNAPHLPHKSCAANKMGYVSASPWNLGILKP